MNQILKQSRGFQANESSDVIDHVLLAKRIKLRYSVICEMFLFFDASFRASVSNVTSLNHLNILFIFSIVEVHKLILDVCGSLINTVEKLFVDKLFGKSFILTVLSQNHWL